MIIEIIYKINNKSTKGNRMNVTFITGNNHKFNEAKEVLPNLIQQNIDLSEIQEVDPQKIIEAKLLEAYKIYKSAYIVEDTSLFFDCFDSLPGPLIKWFLNDMGNSGLYKLVNTYNNSRAKVIVWIGYIDNHGEIQYFNSSIEGSIVKPVGENGFGWDQIFKPDGFNKTFAEMSFKEKNKMSMRKDVFMKLKHFLENEN